MIRILTDSTSDLNSEIIQRYQLEVIPLSVHVAEQTFKDEFDFTAAQLFALVEEHGELPKTAAPSVADFVRAFQEPGEALYLGISSRLSATVVNAQAALECVEPGKVRVIDSLNLSSGLGLLALHAADLRDAGHTAAEIEQGVLAALPRVRMSFVIDTMRYLYLGGRCTALQSLVGGLLKIRPIIAARPDGTLGVKEKVRGSRKRALDSLLRDFETHLERLDPSRVFVTHCVSEEDAAYLAEALAERAPIEELWITEAGAVVSSHCGPGTIGVLYMLKEEEPLAVS